MIGFSRHFSAISQKAPRSIWSIWSMVSNYSIVICLIFECWVLLLLLCFYFTSPEEMESTTTTKTPGSEGRATSVTVTSDFLSRWSTVWLGGIHQSLAENCRPSTGVGWLVTGFSASYELWMLLLFVFSLGSFTKTTGLVDIRELQDDPPTIGIWRALFLRIIWRVHQSRNAEMHLKNALAVCSP